MNPQSDNVAYDGNIIIKTTTFGKSNKSSSKLAEVDRVKRAIKILEDEADKRLTIDRLDLSSGNSLEFQVHVNKAVSAELRKINLMLKTFVKNNSIDNE